MSTDDKEKQSVALVCIAGNCLQPVAPVYFARRGVALWMGVPKSEIGGGSALSKPSLKCHLLVLVRPKKAITAATVAVLGCRHLVDHQVMRVHKVSPKENATSLAVPAVELRERLHFLECVDDDDEALPRCDAIHELHGADP